MSYLGPVSSSRDSDLINYIVNGKALMGTTDWVKYNNTTASAVPEVSPGGSTTGTNFDLSVSTSSPLRGAASFSFAKAAVNAQGRGYYVPFTIDSADQAKVLSISFDYEITNTTGLYADGDVVVYIVDVTNSQVIQPAGFQLLAGTSGQKLRHIATFQTASNSTSYRLYLHVASTSGTKVNSIKADSFRVGPQVVQYGAPVTDWVSLSGVTTTNFPTSLITALYRRVGDSAHIQIRTVLSGAATGALGINIPNTLQIDESKLSTATQFLSGTAKVTDVSLNTVYVGVMYQTGSDSQRLSFYGPNTGGNWTNTNPVAGGLANGDVVELDVIVPISGWSSTVQMSNDTDTRVVAARIQGPSVTGFTSTPTNPVLTGKLFDTHGAYNTVTGIYTVPVSGYYKVTYGGRLANSQAMVAGASVGTYVYKNSSLNTLLSALPISAAVTPANGFFWTGSAVISANAGDTLEIRNSHDMGGTKNLLSAAADGSLNYVIFERLSGPSAIAASETVAMAARKISGNHTANGSDQTVAAWDLVITDSHGAFNATTGIYTVPVSGRYLITGQVNFNTGSGTQWAFIGGISTGGGINQTGARVALPFSLIRQYNAGETISVVAFQNTSASFAYSTDARFCTQLNISRLGN